MTVIDATLALARRHRLSERQARRYVERARDEGVMEVATPKVVFTVKLPAALARRVRRAARATGQSISALGDPGVGRVLGPSGSWLSATSSSSSSSIGPARRPSPHAYRILVPERRGRIEQGVTMTTAAIYARVSSARQTRGADDRLADDGAARGRRALGA